MPNGMNQYEKAVHDEIMDVYKKNPNVKPLGAYIPDHGPIDVDQVTWKFMKNFLKGGHIEVVGLQSGAMLIVDEDGMSKNLPQNKFASMMVGGLILGNVVYVPAKWKRSALK